MSDCGNFKNWAYSNQRQFRRNWCVGNNLLENGSSKPNSSSANTDVKVKVFCSIWWIWTYEQYVEILKFPDLPPPNIGQHFEATRCFNNHLFHNILKNWQFPRMVMSQIFFLVHISKIRYFWVDQLFFVHKIQDFAVKMGSFAEGLKSTEFSQQRVFSALLGKQNEELWKNWHIPTPTTEIPDASHIDVISSCFDVDFALSVQNHFYTTMSPEIVFSFEKCSTRLSRISLTDLFVQFWANFGLT